MPMKNKLNVAERVASFISSSESYRQYGRIQKSVGMTIEASGLKSGIGDICIIELPESEEGAAAEVVGFRDDKLILMTLRDSPGILPGAEVRKGEFALIKRISDQIVGRVIDGLGNPIDDAGEISGDELLSWHNLSPHPLKRHRIRQPFYTGVRSIDSLITIGKGQRAGIFAGSGVGKSVLLGMIARNSYGDVNVIGLIGERGREVREFIEKDLGEEGLKRSVVVVVTSDKSPLMKIKGAFLCTAVAEYFRAKGNDVLLMMDSLTRVATAQREIGLAAGEPPTTRGYTPSCFAIIPNLLERAGASEKGSITGLYNVLVEGDDLDEPVADTARASLDGHIVLSRKLANRHQFPAIDVNASISRVMPDIIPAEHYQLAKKCLKTLAVYNDSEDLINIGAYNKGSSRDIDYALDKIDPIRSFLQQGISESSDPKETLKHLSDIFSDSEGEKDNQADTNDTSI